MSAATATAERRTLLVDGHVHFHACFDLTEFLGAARANFEAAARQLGEPRDVLGCLMFTESAWDHYFRAFRDGKAPHPGSGWSFESTGEAESVLAQHEHELRLLLFAGRQVVTSERLEVLALATDREFADGRPLRDVIAAVRDADSVPVVPWGFGKWWSERGRVLRECLESTDSGGLFLGDNGGRLALSPAPSLFALARSRGIPVLPGSDPLPFPRENRTVARFGFALDGVDDRRDAAAVKAALRDVGSEGVRVFGRREGLLGFCRNQVAMQLRDRGGATP